MIRAYFNETQRFRQWWIYLVIVISLGAWIYAVSASIHSADSEKVSSDITLILTGLVPVLLVILILVLRLETKIRNTGIYFRFKPLQFREKHIRPEDINSFEVRKYKPILEYGGWGYRTGRIKSGKAYNVSGNIGLQLYLKNGKKLLIGTKKPLEIEKAMKVMLAQVTGSGDQVPEN